MHEHHLCMHGSDHFFSSRENSCCKMTNCNKYFLNLPCMINFQSVLPQQQPNLNFLQILASQANWYQNILGRVEIAHKDGVFKHS